MSWLEKGQEIDVILASSGVRASCFIGGLTALEENGYKIKRIAGSSGGAIIAAAYALGLSPDELTRMAVDTPYQRFKDFRLNNLLSLSNPSVYKGQELDNYYKSIYGDATLSDFKIDCKISVVTIIGRKRILLDRESHPDLPIWKAVRMSSTIPFIFPYLELEGDPVTDGGLVTNMFDIFPESVRPIIGLKPRQNFDAKRDIQNIKASKLLVWNYLKIVIEYFLDVIDSVHMPAREWLRTIIIPTDSVGGFNFELTEDDISTLIKSGYDAVNTSELIT